MPARLDIHIKQSKNHFSSRLIYYLLRNVQKFPDNICKEDRENKLHTFNL